MSLFTRLLASLYPEQLLNQPGSPAGLFLGMISPQSFFNVIIKKMAENYKINRFDLAIDPFEVKIGFGEQSMIKPKAMQSYYSYCSAANLNGYQGYSIGSVATCVVLMASHYLRPLMSTSTSYWYFTQLLFSLYAVVHVVAIRLRQFPEEDSNESVQWFLDIWFNYYQVLLETNAKKQPFDQVVITLIKSRVSSQVELCFGLYRMMKLINGMMVTTLDHTYFAWLYDNEFAKNTDMSQDQLFSHIMNHVGDSTITAVDYDIMQKILPYDFMIKYFFGQQDVFIIVDYIVDGLYDYSIIDDYFVSCLDGDESVVTLIQYICQYQHMKKNFFVGARELVMGEIRSDDEDNEIEEFMSMIDSGTIQEIPDIIRKESLITERLMNFYLNYMGGLWAARGDTFVFMFHPQLSAYIRHITHDVTHNSYEFELYHHYLTQYIVNNGYYGHVYQGVRSGKASFTLPYIIESDKTEVDFSMINLLMQSSLMSMMQDMLYKEIKLYPQSKILFEYFKQSYGHRVASYLKFDSHELLSYVIPLDVSSLVDVIDHSSIINMRESLYTIDLHCYHDVASQLLQHEVYRAKYGASASILIAGTLRETLYGVLCMMAMIEHQSKYNQSKSQELIQFLLTSYVIHVVGLQDTATMIICFDIIYLVYRDISVLLTEVIQLDDNEEFLMIGIEFMSRFLKGKSDSVNAHSELLNEDVVWLRGYLKHINYYNKRYFIPQN